MFIEIFCFGRVGKSGENFGSKNLIREIVVRVLIVCTFNIKGVRDSFR